MGKKSALPQAGEDVLKTAFKRKAKAREGLPWNLSHPKFAGLFDLPLDDLAAALGLHPCEEADLFEPLKLGSTDFYLHFSTFGAIPKKFEGENPSQLASWVQVKKAQPLRSSPNFRI